MAKTKKKLITDLDESMPKRRKSKSQDGEESFSEPAVEAGAGDDVTYNMGDIQVSDSDEGDEDFKKASQKVMVDADEDGEEDWVDEELNFKDEDIFLDMDQDFDIDNPYSDED